MSAEPPAEPCRRLRGVYFIPTMSVIPLTLTISLCLVFTFVVFFIRENSRRFGSAERDSLLPLAEEKPRVSDRHRG